MEEKSSMAATHVSIVVTGEHAEDASALLQKPLLLHDGGQESGSAEDSEGSSDDNGTSSFTRTCFNGLNALSGVGILSIPYALSKGGWLSLLILFAMAIIFYYTGLLIQRCMSAHPSIKSYPDIGEFAFGYKGRVIASAFLYLELYLVAIGYLILEGDNLDKLFPDTSFELGKLSIAGKQCFVVLVTLIILPTTWFKSLGMIAYISIGGVLASVIVVGCVLWAALVDDVGFHERGRFINFRGLPTALGLYAFSYCGHAVFPTICTSMKDKPKFSKVLLICFALCTLNNVAMAIFGYLMYGDEVQSQVTLNLPVGKLSTNIAVITTLINPITKFALTLTPVAVAIEERLVIHKKAFASLLARTTLTLSTMVVALSIPYFGNLMALVGSFLGISVSVLLPCICYLKIFKINLRNFVELVTVTAITVVGILIAVMGTYSSLEEIMNKL